MDKKPKNKIQAAEFVTAVARLAKTRLAKGEVVDLAQIQKKLKVRPALFVIEDDETLRNFLLRIFTKEDYQVYVAKDAIELMHSIEGINVDLLIIDVNLPWIDGFEIVELMKQNAALKNIPVVFISADDDVKTIKKGFAVGADDYLVKPFKIEQALKTVKTLLALKTVGA